MPDIKHSVMVDAPPETIYPLVSSAQGLSKWWAEDVTEHNDGTVELGFFNKQTIYRLKPVKMQGPHTAEWLCTTGKEWAGTTIRVGASRERGETVLTLTHAGWKSETDYFHDCEVTWELLLLRLKAEAEGVGEGPYFTREGLSS